MTFFSKARKAMWFLKDCVFKMWFPVLKCLEPLDGWLLMKKKMEEYSKDETFSCTG